MTMTTENTTPPARSSASRWLAYLAIAAIVIFGALYVAGAFHPQPRVAIVTAAQGPYWDLIIRGAQDAAEKANAKLTIVRENGDEPTQTRDIAALLGQGYDGVGISPNDALRQAATLSDIGGQCHLITYDSDCPISQRLCFIGTDNYDAGRTCAQYIRQAIPEGGDVIVAVGNLEKENGQRRRQGVIDELLERSFEPNRPMDPVNANLKGNKYNIVATLVDGINANDATTLAVDALKKNPSAKAFACLFAYNTPAVLKALEQSNKLGKLKVVGFDFHEETLAGIENGTVFASMMQDPYTIGYQTVRILADLARGDRSSLPMFQVWHLPCDPITKATVADARQRISGKPMVGKPLDAAPASLTPQPATSPAQPSTAPSST